MLKVFQVGWTLLVIAVLSLGFVVTLLYIMDKGAVAQAQPNYSQAVYLVICMPTASELAYELTMGLASQDFQPQGGVAIDDGEYCQAVIGYFDMTPAPLPPTPVNPYGGGV